MNKIIITKYHTIDICIWCKEPINGFKNVISKKEYTISGLCQSCQDKTFGKDKDDK